MNHHHLLRLLPLALLALLACIAQARPPTHADVPYGPHARNVLDFYQADSAQPTPLVIYIHGGGFISGDKAKISEGKDLRRFLDAGVSCAAINYRYITAPASPDIPLQDVLRDCARALQFLRSRAAELNIDKTRVAAFGSSAGAGTSLWLAAHPDLADPQNADPVLRESTRLACVGAMSTQFTYDFPRWREVFGDTAFESFGGRYRSPALYGFKTEAELQTPEGLRIRADCDMYALLSPTTPPVFLSTKLPDLDLTNSSQFLHHPRHAQLIYERCKELGVPVTTILPALNLAPAPGQPKTWHEFALRHLASTTP